MAAHILDDDDRMGHKRPEQVASLLTAVDAKLEAARELRLARDQWEARQQQRYADHRVIAVPERALLALAAGAERDPAAGWTGAGCPRPRESAADDGGAGTSGVKPPRELEAAHSLLVGAMQWPATRAVENRFAAVQGGGMQQARDAASAASGALLLFDRATLELPVYRDTAPTEVITPRNTRLWRTPDLQAFQRAIVDLLPSDPFEADACAAIVPSQAAAEQWRRTIEETIAEPGAVRIPAANARRPVCESPPACDGQRAAVERIQREALLRRSADAASSAGAEPPFNIRPGLIAAILDLYDDLRRRDKTVADFDRLLTAALEPGADYDRGTARLLQQTRFLVETFTRFEAAIQATGRFDEHRFRDVLLRPTARPSAWSS